MGFNDLGLGLSLGKGGGSGIRRIIKPFFNGMVWSDDPYGITGGPNTVADWNSILQPGHADQPSIPGMRYATTVAEGAIQVGEEVIPQWVPEVGPELVTNGGFDTDSDWTKGTGWTIANGVATHTGSDSNMSQDMGLESGKTYLVLWGADCSGGTAGIDSSCYSSVMGDNDKTEDGAYSTLIVSNGSDFAAYCDGDASLDNISVREVPPNYAPWLTDSEGDPDYTTTDSTSVVPYDLLRGQQVPNNMEYKEFAARTNNALYCRQFDRAYWNKLRVIVSSNVSLAPDNTTTADLIYPSETTAIAWVYSPYINTAAITTISVHAKAAGKDWLIMANSSATVLYASFNLSTGEVGTVASGYDAKMVVDGNGFYRCSVTTPTEFNDRAIYGVADADNNLAVTVDGTSGIYLWQAQLETGDEATWDIETTNATVTMPAGVYSRVNPLACKGVLVEPVRTNKATCVKANPADTTNLSVTGGTLSVAADPGTLLSDYGAEDICTDGNLYKWVNATGSLQTLTIGGTVGNTNAHSLQVLANCTGAAGGMQLTGGLGAVVIPNQAGLAKYTSENITPGNTTDQMQLTLADGGTMHFIQMQPEEGAFCTSVIWRASDYTEPATSITRPANVIEAPSAGILRGNCIGGILQFIPSATGQTGWALNSYVDGNNGHGIYVEPTQITFRKTVGGVDTDCTVSYTHANGVPVRLIWVQTFAGTKLAEQHWLGLAWSTLSAYTDITTDAGKADLQIGSTFQIGARNGSSHLCGNYQLALNAWKTDPTTYLEELAV